MAYLWKHEAWRSFATDMSGRDRASVTISLADSKPVALPVLFAQVAGGELWWGLQRSSPAASEVRLVKAVSGECLRWEGE